MLCNNVRKNFFQNFQNLGSSCSNGVRVDTAAYAGYVIPPFYDSMIAKLLVRAKTRNDAISKMLNALDEFVIEGIPTTVDYHKKILSHPDFISGNYDTSFIDKYFGK